MFPLPVLRLSWENRKKKTKKTKTNGQTLVLTNLIHVPPNSYQKSCDVINNNALMQICV